MRRSTLLADAAAIAFDAPTAAPRVSAPGALEPEPTPGAVPGVDASAAVVLLLGAAIIVSFQSFGSTSFFERHFATAVDGWPKAGMYNYLYRFGSCVAWLFVLPVLIIIALPGAGCETSAWGRLSVTRATPRASTLHSTGPVEFDGVMPWLLSGSTKPRVGGRSLSTQIARAAGARR